MVKLTIEYTDRATGLERKMDFTAPSRSKATTAAGEYCRKMRLKWQVHTYKTVVERACNYIGNTPKLEFS